MYSREHGLISLVVGVGLVLAGVELRHPLVVVGYATAVGVLIDLDHFVIARVNTGEWRALRYLIENPRRALADQGTIFRDDDLTAFERLLSHVVLIGLAVPATWLVSPSLGLVTAVTLYAHVLADLVADVRNFDTVERDPRL